MATDLASAWDSFSAQYQSGAVLPTDVAYYGPDIPTEADLRLLGDVKGKRILELGCGAGQTSIAFAKAGATAIGVDFSPAQLRHGRDLCDAEDVKVELRLGDMADLAFLRADSIDVVFSAFAFQYVEDLNRIFRQAHRVLKVGSPLVFSLPHPAYPTIGEAGGVTINGEGLLLKRSYFDRSRVEEDFGPGITSWHHSFSELYMGLNRASYRVDLVIEPEPIPGAPRSSFWQRAMDFLPRTLIIRARKEGS